MPAHNACHQSDLGNLSPFVQKKTHKSRHLTQAVVAGVISSFTHEIFFSSFSKYIYSGYFGSRVNVYL